MVENLLPSQLKVIASSDQLQLLDQVDKLRSHGVSHHVSIPQIMVCGDQSSGKSSTLEAISGIPFPTKINLCTRFAAEVVLRKGPTTGISVTILPSQSGIRDQATFEIPNCSRGFPRAVIIDGQSQKGDGNSDKRECLLRRCFAYRELRTKPSIAYHCRSPWSNPLQKQSANGRRGHARRSYGP